MPFTVSFSDSVLSKGWNVDAFRHECLYTVNAEASGGPEGAFAVWSSGDLGLRYENEPADTSNVQSVDILNYWGTGQIKAGSVLEANRIAWGPSSFELLHTFVYRDWKGQSTSKTIIIDCTAPPPTGSISGTIAIDGVGAEGVPVTISTGETTTTDASGRYTVSGLPMGAYRVTIPGQLGDVVFPTTSQVAVIRTPDEVVSINFGGFRSPAAALSGWPS